MESSPYFYEDKVHCDNGSAFCLQRAKKRKRKKKKKKVSPRCCSVELDWAAGTQPAAACIRPLCNSFIYLPVISQSLFPRPLTYHPFVFASPLHVSPLRARASTRPLTCLFFFSLRFSLLLFTRTTRATVPERRRRENNFDK